MGKTMADHDAPRQVRAPETIHVTVLRARNLKGVKGDVVNATVKLEFGEKPLGESAKVECTPEIPGEFNFDGTINFTFDDPVQYDEILSKPVILTLSEVLPKEKKQKEEKTVVLGQCTFDLLPLVQGETKYKYTLQLFPVAGSPLEGILADQPRPEVDVQLSVAESLLTESQKADANLLTVTMETLYSPPETWQASGVQNIYTCCLPIPATADKESCVVFPNGQLKTASDKEAASKQKRWLLPGSLIGGAAYMPDNCIAESNIEDEDGDYKSKEDREHRQASEQEKNRVIWNSDKRCFLEANACRSLKEKIAKNRYLPVEIFRITSGGGGKGGRDDSGAGFHGIAFVDVAPLLYPGVKRIRGCYKVLAYSDDELITKTGRKVDLSEECLKITNNIMLRTGNSPFPKKGEKGGEKKDTKKPAKPTDSASETDGQAPVNVEGQQYVEAKSFICLEINLSRPLVPKRPAEELAKRVAEYIPPRPLFPKRTNCAEKAVEDYHSQIASVASLVLDEFRNLYGEEIEGGDLPQTPQDLQNRRQKLIYELNASGKYFAFKEQLKYAVVKIVREKYLKTTKFQDPNELQAFLSELYVFLVDQMHVGMHKVLSLEDQTPVPKPLTDSAQLKHFAREAEVNENYEWANKYYQERIARDKNSSEHWLDYGVFSLYLNDLTKAEECFKECVSIDPRHLSGLLLYGIVCSMQERHDVAETFFEAATCVAPDDITAWTMFGLFYDSISNDIQAEMAFIEANKKNLAGAKAMANKAADEQQAKLDEAKEAAAAAELERLEKLELVPESDEIDEPVADPMADDKSRTESPKSPKQGSRLAMDKKMSGSSKKGLAGLRAKSTESSVSARPGSKLKVAGEPPQAAAAEEEVQEPVREDTPVPCKTIFMQAIEFLLEVKAMPYTERALAHELLEPNGGPTLTYQICHARLKLQKKEYQDAEMSLRRAIEEEYENAEAWSIMGHLKYLAGDTMAAKDCYERTLAFVGEPSEMHSIYLRLASIYLHEGRFQDAKTTFLYACKKSPSCVSWLGVGISCYRLDELNEAEDALAEANMLNNYDAEVWAYLSLVCLKTERQIEAEQAYKYALKLNLQDDELMSELQELQAAVGFGDPQL